MQDCQVGGLRIGGRINAASNNESKGRMRTMNEHEEDSQWVSRATAAKHLGCNPHAVSKLAQAGHVTVRRLPGCDPRYLLSDLERLAQESTRTAIREATDRGEGGER